MQRPEQQPSTHYRAPPTPPDKRLVPKTPGHRFQHLDSLRGIAALIVVSAHYLASFYPYAVFGSRGKYPQREWWEDLFFFPPLSFLTAGHFAVSLFFVLSGFVLSYRYIGEKGNAIPVIGATLKRPIRLAGLFVVSVLIGAFLWKFNLLFHREAAEVSGSQAWLGTFWKGQFSGEAFLQRVLTFSAGGEYNPPLWTIRIELIGSLLVFGTLLAINGLRYRLRLLAMVLLIMICYASFYQGFFIGMIIADLQKYYRKSRPLVRLTSHRHFKHAVLLMLIPALFFVGYPYYAFESIKLRTIYGGLPDLSMIAANYAMVGAASTFLLVSFSGRLKQALRLRGLVWIGNVSYAVYVFHFLILATVVSRLVVHLDPVLGYGAAVLISSAVGLLILMPVAYWATRWIDKPILRLASTVERWSVAELRRQLSPKVPDLTIAQAEAGPEAQDARVRVGQSPP